MDLRNDTLFERRVRDPVHRYIVLTRLENRIIDSPFFQRLNAISQMHSAHLVYPGAQYSRKAHSMGAMQVAHRIISHLLLNQFPPARKGSHSLLAIDRPVDKKHELNTLRLEDGLRKLALPGMKSIPKGPDLCVYIIQIVRLAALLHDIGHGPFSHLFETASRQGDKRFNHEKKGMQIIRTELTTSVDGAKPLLEAHDAEFIARIIDENSRKSLVPELFFLHRIISSALDADKMDYLMRDAYYAGTPEYGTIDLDRLIEGMVVNVSGETGDSKLGWSSSSLDTLISALNSMFFMYSNVYLHRTVRTFDFAASRGLGKIAPFLRSLGDGTCRAAGYSGFENLDEANFLEILHRRAEQEKAKTGRKETDFQDAFKAIQSLRRREKLYRVVVNERIGVPLRKIALDGGLDDTVELLRSEIKKRFIQPFEDKVKVEILETNEKNIRPIGLKLDDLLGFLQAQVIYDAERRAPASFKQYAHYYKTLNRIVVPLTWYVAYPEYARLERKYSRERHELRRNINSFLHLYVSMWDPDLGDYHVAGVPTAP